MKDQITIDAGKLRSRAIVALEEEQFRHSLMLFNELISRYNFPSDYGWRGFVQSLLYNLPEAVLDYERDYSYFPLSFGTNRALAIIRSSSPFPRLRNGKKAMEHAQIWKRYEESPSWRSRTILASCFSELDDFKSAVEELRKAMSVISKLNRCRINRASNFDGSTCDTPSVLICF